jgi:ribonuclease HI
MVKQIQGKYKVKSPDLRPLFDEAKRRIALLRRFEISHALRHKNKDADRLANEAMDRGMGKQPAAAPAASANASQTATVLRGFTRDGSIHLLGGAKLPDGVFVKVIPE